jgi:membrane-associated phospholipid phosphatase
MLRSWILVVLAGACLAQQSDDGGATRKFMRDVRSDQIALCTSPFKMSKKTWLTTALPVIGATALLTLADAKVAKSLPNTDDQVRISKAISQAGAFYTLGAGVVGTALVGKFADKPEAVHTSVLAGRSLISTTLLTYTLKFATGRERPTQGNGDGRFWKAKDSFPSGHAMATWAVATTIARRPNCPKWLAITSYVAASAVSFSRIGARKHFPSDVFAGAALGSLVGSRMARQP